MAHANQNIDIHDEKNYDPTVWVPKTHSHGTRDIWIKLGILAFLTILDVALYFAWDPCMARNIVFIFLGIVKAVYIVGTFMHMKHEKLSFATMIIAPMFLIVFLIAWMLFEGNFWGTF
jgi:cytochrome c oxidase subunit IV